jgi:hypothetical protein
MLNSSIQLATMLGRISGSAMRVNVRNQPSPLGDRLQLQLDTPIGRQCVVVLGYQPIAIGERVSLTVAPEHVHFLPEEPAA